MLLTDVGLFSHLIAAVGFSALAVAALWRRDRSPFAGWLAVAAITTALWGVAFVAAATNPYAYGFWLTPAGTLRSAAWIAFLIAVLRPTWRLDDRSRSSFVIAGAVGFVVALQLVLDLRGATEAALSGDRSILSQLFLILRLTVAVTGLVLVHNLYVNTDPTGRGGVRLLAIGLAGFFIYDLNFYTLAFLLPPPSSDLFNIRGAVDTITVPLLLLSTREAWVARVQVSRQVVFHTLSFSMIGFYLIAMALLAYGLRLVGGNWGLLLQISFLFATVILGLVVLFSPRFRAALRVQIAKNFFAYRYDYRVEWLRFIATVSRTQGGRNNGAGGLHERVIQAVCAVLDSPGGLLFVPDGEVLQPIAEWNNRTMAAEPIPRGSGFAADLEGGQRIIAFDELRAGIGDDVALPAWVIANPRVWLGVPLVHLDSFTGFLVLERTVAPRTLNWEDYDLLRTLGRQAASYIAESSTQMALDDAAKFDEFNRRFAFIMHDIKNLVSQLSLVARNAERHADNPAFRADMVATLQSSVGKMNDMLARLSQRPSGRSEPHRDPVDILAVLDQAITVKRHAHAPLTLAVTPDDSGTVPVIAGDTGQIEQLFLHLVQNAIDASTPDAPIAVTAGSDAGEVVIRIADRGRGMSSRFIREELFQPFRSTKSGGFGIGAYEAREIVRVHGGRLDVVSREDEGTTFTIVLPRLATAAHQVAAQ
ncbi:XrtA/PEP-CTERM system histidine kinase PrsK [Sandarakinorhabdus sp. DWP1-3-1]|uniref:XrtA/PEP-CTERM system histidine kinase PrsK n=1 Tax=Sandarakinorhabdus sp. DWP1-3-1 TaxID=2804627 RepID=UPI003CFA50BF